MVSGVGMRSADRLILENISGQEITVHLAKKFHPFCTSTETQQVLH